MTIGAFTRRVAVCLLAAVFSSCAILGRSAAATTETGGAPARDPRLDMVAALQAVGSHPSMGDQAKVFGRLIGTWDVEYTEFSKEGTATHSSGEVIDGWVMEARYPGAFHYLSVDGA